MRNRAMASGHGTDLRAPTLSGQAMVGMRGPPYVKLAVVCCAILVASGCLADPAGPSIGAADGTLRGESQSQLSVEADLVAGALALAMNEPAIRLAVRNAMRASLVTEHKLVLQEFAATEAGRAIVDAAARAHGISHDSLQNLIRKLPPSDFYMPSAAHRAAWRGEGKVIVAAAFDKDVSRVTGTRSDGVRQVLASGDPTATPAVFLLQPAERKSRRIRPQRPGPGLTIQDSDDGQISGTFVEYRPDGTTRVTELADYFALKPTFSETSSCDPTIALTACESESGGGGTISPDTTYLEHVIIIDVCDNGFCNQGNEFEWHTYFSSDNGATFGSRFDLRVEGVPSNFEGTWNVPALLKKIRYPQDVIISDVVETDTFSPSDHFNPSPTWDYYNLYGRLKFEGDDRCGRPKPYGGTYTCDGTFFWKEVNQSMRW